jgi:hypothetical protein
MIRYSDYSVEGLAGLGPSMATSILLHTIVSRILQPSLDGHEEDARECHWKIKKTLEICSCKKTVSP